MFNFNSFLYTRWHCQANNLAHTVKQSQFMSKNSISDKWTKLWNWIFTSKIHNIQQFLIFRTKSQFLARKFNLFRQFLHLKIVKILTSSLKNSNFEFPENEFFGHNLRFSNSVNLKSKGWQFLFHIWNLFMKSPWLAEQKSNFNWKFSGNFC